METSRLSIWIFLSFLCNVNDNNEIFAADQSVDTSDLALSKLKSEKNSRQAEVLIAHVEKENVHGRAACGMKGGARSVVDKRHCLVKIDISAFIKGILVHVNLQYFSQKHTMNTERHLFLNNTLNVNWAFFD